MAERKHNFFIYPPIAPAIALVLVMTMALFGCTQQKQSPVAGDSSVKSTQGGTGTGVMVDEKDQKPPINTDEYKPMPMPNPDPQQPTKGAKNPVEAVTRSIETNQKSQEDQKKD